MNQNQQPSDGGKHEDDAALTDFLASLMDYTPTMPDELVEHYLAKSGFQCPDVRLIRLVAVATQKFVSEVATDALQQCKARQASIVKDKRDKQQKDKRLILTMEDLSRALREYGVNVKHQEYFADCPSNGMDPATREENKIIQVKSQNTTIPDAADAAVDLIKNLQETAGSKSSMQANVVIDDLGVGESSSILEFEIVNVTNGDAAIAIVFWTPRCGLAKGLNLTPNRTMISSVKFFLGQDYDALAAAMTIRANSSLYVDFTMPYTESGVAMVVRTKDYTSKNAWVFLKPLSWDLWPICLCFFIWTGFAVSVLEHRINEEFRGPPSDQVGTRFSGPILIAGVASSLALIISAASFFYRYGYVLMTRVAFVWRRIRDMFGTKNSGLDAIECLPAASASQAPQAIQITQI